LGEALFQGNDAFGQLQLIYTKLGTPSIDDLKDMHVRERDFIPALVSQAVYPFRELFLVSKYIDFTERTIAKSKGNCFSEVSLLLGVTS